MFSFEDITGMSPDDVINSKAHGVVWKATNEDGSYKTKTLYNERGQELVVNVYTDGEKTFTKRLNTAEQKKANISARS